MKQYAGVGFSSARKLTNALVLQSPDYIVPYGSDLSSIPDYILCYNHTGYTGSQVYLIKLNGQEPTPDTIINGQFSNFGISNAMGDRGACLVMAPNRVFSICGQTNQQDWGYKETSVDMATWNAGIAAGTGVSFPGANEFFKHVQTYNCAVYGWYDSTTNLVYYYVFNPSNTPPSTSNFWIRVYNADTGAFIRQDTVPNTYIANAVDPVNGILYISDRSSPNSVGKWDYRTNTLVSTPVAPPVPLQLLALGLTSPVRVLEVASAPPYGAIYEINNLTQVFPGTISQSINTVLNYTPGSALYNTVPGIFTSRGTEASVKYEGAILSTVYNSFYAPANILMQTENIRWTLGWTQPQGPLIMLLY
jgi:hypothetical protein